MEKENMVRKVLERLRSSRMPAIARIASEIRISAGRSLREQGFIEINPVIISPLTDPLHHKTLDSAVRYLDRRYYLTRSMIFHKQIALLALDRIFAFSPNVRLEPPAYGQTGRHLIEFTQIDLEMKDADRSQAMAVAERLLTGVLDHVRGHCAPELSLLGRELAAPAPPFKQIKYLDARREYGDGFELRLSRAAAEPFWIIDIPVEAREFYDREYEDEPGILCDMDLIYPEGFGEALSGGEREYVYERIRRRMRRYDSRPANSWWFLKIARAGLPASAGFGLGLERLVRYVCGLKDILETTLFPKVPGGYSL